MKSRKDIIYENIGGDSHYYYYENGKHYYHNEEGPAFVGLDGYEEYCLHGEMILVNSLEEFKKYIELIAFI